MAAPSFTSPLALRADLATLGYPNLDDKSVHTHGEPRIAVLTWLAQQADPTFIPSTTENLAAFWDRLGVHSATPNNAGHRIPMTAPTDRPRDKTAANCFLRAAIDLVFAFRARRAEDPLSDTWLNDGEEIQEDESPLSQFDSESLEQLDMLINQRHLLFPNTTKLFQSNPPKKRPLQRRSVNTNKKVNRPVSRMKKLEKAEKDCVPSREHVLERLRQVQRRANDLEAEVKDRRSKVEDSQSPQEDDDIATLDDTTVTELADGTTSLCNLMRRFECITVDVLAERESQTDLAKRDPQMEDTLSGMSKECIALHKNTLDTFDSMRRVKASVEELARIKPLLEGLPDSAAVQEVLRHRQRTEEQM